MGIRLYQNKIYLIINSMKKYRFIIGIDTGVKTGYSVWDCEEKKFLIVETTQIHSAMGNVEYGFENLKEIKVRVEDARKRKWFGKSGREQLQGAGSIKRDAKIWEDFLTHLKVDFEMVAPKNNKTKLNAETFRNLTKWQGRTTEHSRDSAMLVWQLNQ